MSDTGRLGSAVSPEIAALVFAPDPSDAGVLRLASRVDLAHVVMLAEVGLLDVDTARQLCAGVQGLAAEEFDAVLTYPRPRGLFLAYEACLIDRLGVSVGGALQTARSRNDLNATVARLRIRQPLSDLELRTQRLIEIALTVGDEHRETTMPSYSHFQAAMPITYGHYFVGVAWALLRDLRAIDAVADELDVSPLGAGAGAGTTFAIDPERTARLLGFSGVMLNSVEAVASRDGFVRAVAHAAVLGIVVDRVAGDLLLWSSEEFGFLALPDEVVGSSSMMPQKRNPFVLEHVQGRTARAAGGFIEAYSAMRGRPFSNSVAVGTEAMRPVVAALEATGQALGLLSEVVSRAEPRAEVMHARAERAGTVATAVAEEMVRRGAAFRSAHHAVGAAITGAGGELGALAPDSNDRVVDALRAVGGPSEVVRKSQALGGPGPASTVRSLEDAQAELAELRTRAARRDERWQRSQAEMEIAVEQLGASAD